MLPEAIEDSGLDHLHRSRLNNENRATDSRPASCCIARTHAKLLPAFLVSSRFDLVEGPVEVLHAIRLVRVSLSPENLT